MAEPIGFKFTEEMSGYISQAPTSFRAGYEDGAAAGKHCNFRLTIRTDDVDAFVDSAEREAEASGYVEAEVIDGRRRVESGRFNLFVDTEDRNRKQMLYRLFLRDGHGEPLTLSGFKDVQSTPGGSVWKDTTTLYVNLFRGRLEADDEPNGETLASGILTLSAGDFARQLATMRAFGGTLTERLRAFETFGSFFAGSLWSVYRPRLMPKMKSFEREIPLYTTEGVEDAEESRHELWTEDRLGLSMLRFQRGISDDVILIIHGLTTSSDMFIMPEHYNLVQYLLDHDFGDVWTLDFRMSNRYGYNLRRHRYTMDDVALFDMPAAVAKLRSVVGEHKRIHVICHCLGSVSFMMSLFGGAVSGIHSVISNSVSLTPHVPRWSGFKLAVAPFLCDYLLGVEYVNPRWRRQPGISPGKALAWMVSQFHRECRQPDCHMLSFMWGTGFPALYRHENLHEVTHRRGGDLYGGTSVHYYRHVSAMVRADNTAVKYDPTDPTYDALPDNYLANAAAIETPVLFFTGEQNNVFRDSNIRAWQYLESIVPGRHQLHVAPGYGHQDVFMGKDVARDIFPPLLAFLREQSARPADTPATGGEADG